MNLNHDHDETGSTSNKFNCIEELLIQNLYPPNSDLKPVFRINETLIFERLDNDLKILKKVKIKQGCLSMSI